MQARRTKRWWKERWVADHYAQLKSAALLRAHIEHKGVSLTQLAEQATYHRIANGEPKVSRQMISYLVHSDETDEHGKPKGLRTCSPSLAAAIESALQVPDHVLFDVLPKSRDKREMIKGEAA